MRRPVPTHVQCEPTIKREARYWTSAFRGLLSFDDLHQEARIVALKVLEHFDPERNVKIETLLTVALRNHFRRLTKHVLTRAFLYSPNQRADLTSHLKINVRVDPLGGITARLVLARLRTLSQDEQQLARLLITYDGHVRAVARRYQWSLATTYKRVAALRSALTRKGEQR